jgi:hypothetical protein
MVIGRIAPVVLLSAALAVGSGCGKPKPVLRAYDAANRKLIVLTGDQTRPSKFYEKADFVVIGGDLGGIAAAITLCARGRIVILIEETNRIAGCLSPGDTLSFTENELVEKCGTSKYYRQFRDRIREWYEQRSKNPPSAIPGTGGGFCYTTDVAIEVIRTMFEKYKGKGTLTILFRHKVAKVTLFDRRVASVTAIDLDRKTATLVSGWAFIDASIQGDLLLGGGVKNVAGAESRAETNEPHAPEQADSLAAMNLLVCPDPAAFGEKVPGDRAVLDVVETGGAPSPGAYVFAVMKEPRRIKPITLVTERDISAEFQRGPRARFYKDSVGIGFHPIIITGPGGIETAVETKPFQIPLGALLSPDFDNLFAVSGTIGTTRVASTAFTASQTEWMVGEAAGMAASFCGGMKINVQALIHSQENLRQLQNLIVKALDMPIYWYDDVKPGDPDFAEAQLKPFDTPGYHDSASTLHYRK